MGTLVFTNGMAPCFFKTCQPKHTLNLYKTELVNKRCPRVSSIQLPFSSFFAHAADAEWGKGFGLRDLGWGILLRSVAQPWFGSEECKSKLVYSSTLDSIRHSQTTPHLDQDTVLSIGLIQIYTATTSTVIALSEVTTETMFKRSNQRSSISTSSQCFMGICDL